MSEYKDYSKLEKTYDYDKEKASTLAEVMNEATELAKRVQELARLSSLNKDLNKYLWTDASGKVTAFNDLEDDHLANILSYLTANGRDISDPLKAEARSRKLTIPSPLTTYRIDDGKTYNGVPVYREARDDYDEYDMGPDQD